MKIKIVEESPLSFSQVKDVLEASKKKEGELNFRAAKTHEYLESLTVLTAKETKKLADALNALQIPRLKDIHVAKLIDCLPQSEADVRFVLQAYTITVSQENRKKIADEIVTVVSVKQ